MTLLDIALKDLRSSIRSRFALGMMLVVPLLVPALFFLAFGSGHGGKAPAMAPVKVVVVNLDQPGPGVPRFGDMVFGFLSSPQLHSIIVAVETPDSAVARSVVRRQLAAVALIVPPGFSDAVISPGKRAEVRMLCDPALRVGPLIVQSIMQQFLDGLSGSKTAVELALAEHPGASVSGLVEQYRAAATGAEPVHARSPGAGPDDSSFVRQIMGKVMAGLLVFFVFYTGAYTGTSILREEEDGTLQRLFAAPVGRATILGGKLLSVFLTITVQSLVLIGAGSLFFGVQWGGTASAALALAGMVVAAGGFGTMLASFMRNTRQSGPVLGGGLAVAGMLGGLFTPAVPNMPAAFNRIALAMPQGWAMRGWTMAITGRTAADMVLPFAAMVVMGFACFAVGVLFFRRRFA
jgi:ABC-2 type transport system permease protein